MLPRILLSVLVAVLPLGAAPLLYAGSTSGIQAVQGRSIKALQAEIDAKQNRTPRQVFEELGQKKSAAALRVLKASAKKLKGRAAKVRAYAAMRHLLPVDRLGDQVLDHVSTVALEGQSGDAQAAARGLAQFGSAGKPLLRRVVAESKDLRTRQFAFRPIHKQLLEEGGTVVRDLVLKDFIVPESGTEAQALALLRAHSKKPDLKLYRSFVADDERPISMRLLLIRAMEAHGHLTQEEGQAPPKRADAAEAVIQAGLKCDEPRVHYQALVSAAVRSALISGATLRSVKKHAKSQDDATRRAATLLLLEKGDGKLDPLKLAASRDPMMRQAAAIALGKLPGDGSFKELSRLVADKNWTVRAEAVRGLAAQRDRRAIALLVERINRENGRLVADLAAALESLTGRTYGHSPKTWRRFWNKEGGKFTMPSPEQAALAIQARAKRKKDEQGASAASFYGLRVISGRFAIVFDASLSMAAKGKSGKRRIDTAKAQLKGTLESLRDGTLLNLIPFAARVEPLWEEVMPLNEDTKREALAFTQGLEMKLGTDVYDGLYTAFEDEQVDTIYVLSDGASTEGVVKDADGLRAEVSRWNSVRGIKIHCIAIGADHRLLKALAADSGGTYLRVD